LEIIPGSESLATAAGAAIVVGGKQWTHLGKGEWGEDTLRERRKSETGSGRYKKINKGTYAWSGLIPYPATRFRMRVEMRWSAVIRTPHYDLGRALK